MMSRDHGSELAQQRILYKNKKDTIMNLLYRIASNLIYAALWALNLGRARAMPQGLGERGRRIRTVRDAEEQASGDEGAASGW